MQQLRGRLGSPFGGSEAARAMGPGRRLGLVVGDSAGMTIRTTPTGVVVEDGLGDATVVVAVDEAGAAALLAEDLSIYGLLYSGRLRVARGEFDHFAAWEPALQALLYDRPVYDRAAADRFLGEDLTRSFTLDDNPTELAERLDRLGFLHLRAVFAREEIATLSAEVERLRAASRPDDGRSWWATDAAGVEVCCRVTYMADRSEPIAALVGDDRLRRIGDLPGLGLLPVPDRNDGVSVVIKNPSVVSGLSDLPWHRDCGLGGHGLLCPGLNVGIQLDRADAANGQLWFLPGSHRHGGPVGDPEADGLPTVAVDAEPGDVTVHYGHVLHAAPPPGGESAGRRAVYVGFSRPELLAAVPPGKAFNDVIYADGDGRVRNVAEQADAGAEQADAGAEHTMTRRTR
jgi:hypothetical protein